MPEEKVMNRWLVVVGALLIQLCLGAIYAWSVFTPPLQAKTPKDFVDVYAAKQLEIEQATMDKLDAELQTHREKFKNLSVEIKATTDKTEKDKLKKERDQVEAKINAIILNYIPQPNLDKLSYGDDADPGFSNKETQAIFSVGLALFAIVMVLAGRLMPKIGPRNLALSGGVVLGLGYALAGLMGGDNFYLHLFFIGVIGGAGIGLAYVVPIAVAMRWFPDKKGLITGLAVAGFGFGAMGWVKLAGKWGNLISELGLPTVFIIYGIAFFVAVAIGSVWMVFPPKDWKPVGWTPPAPKTAGDAPAAGTVDFKSGEMLATPQFYMILLVFTFSASAGLMSIGLMKAFPITALVKNGIEAVAADNISGNAMAIFFSLANGIGRIAWGAMSDKLGRKTSIVIMCATQGIFVILFSFGFVAGTPVLLYLMATLIGFNFGGNFALFPTITADTFGAKYVGQNYGWVFLAYGIGGVFGPMLGGIFGDLNIFAAAFMICGGLCLLAAVIAGLVKPANKPVGGAAA